LTLGASIQKMSKETGMAIRRALAFPLYCVAFLFQLMTEITTFISAKVAGDEIDVRLPDVDRRQ
jgi:hypothetical protein